MINLGLSCTEFTPIFDRGAFIRDKVLGCVVHW